MVRELERAGSLARGDRSVGAVVITGKPDDLYITHYDVGEILAQRPAGRHRGAALADRGRPAGRRRRAARTGPSRPGRAHAACGGLRALPVHDLFLEMNRSDKVFIAAINGPATGGGCEISLACDIRLMADADIAIGLPEMTDRLQPGAGGTQRLPRLVGVGRALQMMLEGRTLSPREALDHGLIGSRRAARPGQGGGDPHGRAAGAALAGGDPVAEARRLRGRRRCRSPTALRWSGSGSWSPPPPTPRRRRWPHDHAGGGGGASPWATAEGLLPWQDGTAAELVRGSLGRRRAGEPPRGSAAGRWAAPSAACPGSRLSIQKPGVGERLIGGAVGMAPAGEEAPGALQPVLPAAERRAWLLRTCSMKSSLPPSTRTRRASASARCGSPTVQRTSVATTVSKLPSSKGRSSAEASTTWHRPAAPGCSGEPARAAAGPCAGRARS